MKIFFLHLSTLILSITSFSQALKITQTTNNIIYFSKEEGFHSNEFYLSLQSSDSIFYTLDGSEPSTNSFLYRDSILISSDKDNSISLIPTTYLRYKKTPPNNEFGFKDPINRIKKAIVLRVRSFKNGRPSSKIYTKSYFTFLNHYSFPVISITTDSLNLFSSDSGIYVTGNHFDEANPKWSGNYYFRGINYERKSNIELFNRKGKIEFNEQIGLRISGNKTRSAPQKSLRIYFRKEYGKPYLDYHLFNNRDNTSLKRFTLRSSFTYKMGLNTLFLDDLLHTFIHQQNLDIDIQMSTPSIVFINGEYWGIHNMRERIDKYYIQSLHNVNTDNLTIIDAKLNVIEGSSDEFLELINFIDSNDITQSNIYNYVNSKIDIDNYIDYFIIETYFNNIDWPANNLKIWKSNKKDSKWRWLLYDLDASLYSSKANPFKIIERSNSVHAKLFKNLILNQKFKTEFIDRYVFHLKNTFKPSVIIDLIDQFQSKYKPEIPEHISRWGNPINYNKWIANCNYVKRFFKERPLVISKILIEKFGIDNSLD